MLIRRLLWGGVLSFVIKGGTAFGAIGFKEVLDAALRESPTLQGKEANLAVQRLDRDLITYRYLPRMNVLSAYGGLKSEGDDALQKSSRVQLSLTQSLYDFGRTSAARDLASLAEEGSAFEAEKAKVQVTVDVARLFAKALLQQQMVEILAEQTKFAAGKVASQSLNYKRGLRTEGDLLAAEVDQGRVSIALLKAQADLEQVRSELMRLTKISALGSEELAVPSFFVKQNNPGIGWLKVVADWDGQEGRYSEKLLANAVAKSQAELAKVRADGRPDLAFVATLSRSERAPLPRTTEVSGEVKLSWDIPYPGQHRDKIEKQLRLVQLAEDAKADELSVREVARKAALSTLEAQSVQWDAIREQGKRVAKQLALIRTKYETGKASVLDLSNAQAEVLNLQLELVKTVHSLLNTVIDLALLYEKSNLNEVMS